MKVLYWEGDGFVLLYKRLENGKFFLLCSITHNRKNWLFSDSVNGAEASAASYSIIETAKANSIDPYKYLCYIFTYLPGKDINDKSILDSFMPWNKKIQIECK